MFIRAIKSILALCIFACSAFVYAENTESASREKSIEEQIAAFEENREKTNQQIEVVSSMHKDVVLQNKKFIKEANKALADERKQIRDHIRAIDALLKDKPLPTADKCDPDDPNCEDFCRARKGVCYKGHCCS